MKNSFEEAQEEDFNLKVVEDFISVFEKFLKENSMTVEELLLAYGNVGYKIGASLRRNLYDPNFVAEPPNMEQLNELYNKSNTLDLELMLHGLTIISYRERCKG